MRDELWLLGQPPQRDDLDFVRHSVEGGAEMDPRTLVDEWRAANDQYYDLESDESGIADEAECPDLPRSLAPLAGALAEQPHFREAFNQLPVSFGMVEIDTLIVYQAAATATISTPGAPVILKTSPAIPSTAERLRKDRPAAFGDRREPTVAQSEQGIGRDDDPILELNGDDARL